MRKLLLATLLLCSIGHAAAKDDFSQFQASAELGGPGLLYSINGSFRPHRTVALNLGVSYFNLDAGVTLSTGTINFYVIPVTVSYLLGGQSNFLEILAGADFIITSGIGTSIFSSKLKSDFASRNVMPVVGLGYRLWPIDGGFHMRVTGYLFFAGGSVYPWAGLTLGYAF